MAKKKVVVKGGGDNLYYISESSGTVYVYKGGTFGDTQIGKATSVDNALAIIRSHSGRDIERF